MGNLETEHHQKIAIELGLQSYFSLPLAMNAWFTFWMKFYFLYEIIVQTFIEELCTEPRISHLHKSST
jgi:hypothetical protein